VFTVGDADGHGRRDATTATRQDTTRQDIVASVVSVAEAAHILGLTPGAIRKRIERGQLAAHKVSGQWHVVLNSDETTRHDSGVAPDTTRQGDATRQDTTVAVSSAARSQLEAIRDEWLAPLVAQIREQAEEIGRLRADQEAVRRERDALATELERERTQQQRVDELAAAVERRERAHERGAEQLVTALEQERDELRRRVADLEAERLNAAASRQDGPGATEGTNATDEPLTGLRRWWRRLWGGS
jgi:hypothetical protein